MVDLLHFYIVSVQINKDGWCISVSSHLKADTFAAVRWEPLAVKLTSQASGLGPTCRIWGPGPDPESELWSSVDETHIWDLETRFWGVEQDMPSHMTIELMK